MRENVWKEAKKLQKELTKYRRYLHANAETGFNLEKTCAFVKDCLKQMGYTPKKCGRAGIVAEIGRGDNIFLLRADMDALPIREETGLPFACKNGNMHACGHDMHTAMLLGAAKLLKLHEEELAGRVRLLFQPAEEILQGAKDVVDAGVLSGVQGAVALHVTTGDLPVGTAVVSSAGAGAPAADYFTIKISGRACHGSAPQNGIDALTAAAHILIALQEIPARELSPAQPAVLTVGKLFGGSAGNAIADGAELEGTLRAFDEEVRERIKRRIVEISVGIARALRAEPEVLFGSGCPVLVNDEKLSLFAEETLRASLGARVFTSAELGGGIAARNGGSEDFAYIAREVPSVLIALSAGQGVLHNAKLRFDERALHVGAAIYSTLAMNFFHS